MLKILAVFFNVSTDYLLGLTDIPNTIDDYIKKSNIKQFQQLKIYKLN